VYRANRLEEPELIRKGFETAIARFPANGRLHLTYARWLLSTRSLHDDDRDLASRHLKKAMLFEEELVSSSLALLRWGAVPAEEWAELVPETLASRRRLVRTLVQSGFRTEAMEILEMLFRTETDVELFRDGSSWALQWGEPQLALEAAERWRRHEMERGKAGLELARATLALVRAHFALGNPDAAHGAVRETLDLMERQPSATRPARLELLNGMGHEYLRAGRTVLARSSFLKARALAPYDTVSSLGLARAYARDGAKKEAEAQYRRVLELDRTNTEAQQALRALR
jgi:tetratricopeptide (TPR) repeat protein